MVAKRSKWLMGFTPIIKLADPGSNPAWDYDIDNSEVEITCYFSNSKAPG